MLLMLNKRPEICNAPDDGIKKKITEDKIGSECYQLPYNDTAHSRTIELDMLGILGVRSTSVLLPPPLPAWSTVGSSACTPFGSA